MPPPRQVDGGIAVLLRDHVNRKGGVGVVPTLVSGHVSSSRKATRPAMRENEKPCGSSVSRYAGGLVLIPRYVLPSRTAQRSLRRYSLSRKRAAETSAARLVHRVFPSDAGRGAATCGRCHLSFSFFFFSPDIWSSTERTSLAWLGVERVRFEQVQHQQAGLSLVELVNQAGEPAAGGPPAWRSPGGRQRRAHGDRS